MKNGFTLAEVLITLAVIGVIATLTLPNVISNYQERVLMSQLQKTYNLVLNTVPDAMTKEGVTKLSELVNTNEKKLDFLREYFDSTASCTNGNFGDCFAASYKNLRGSAVAVRDVIGKSLPLNTTACGVISTGATICVNSERSNVIGFIIDVNGKEKPNQYGKDVFWFALRDNGKPLLATETLEGRNSSTFDINVETNQLRGASCTTQNDTLYLKGTTCLPKIISNGWKFD